MDLEIFWIKIGLNSVFSLFAALIYYQRFCKRDVASATVLFSLFVFLIVYFVSFENNLGLGIGLLGILSLIRLRSVLENLIDLSFIFYGITIGLLNASIVDLQQLAIVNALAFFVLWILLARIFFRKNIVTTRVIFDEIDLKKLSDRNYLKKHIKNTLGITSIFATVTKVDYLKDTVTVRISYEAK